MIIVQVIGGLGNQMFQYAVGKHLAIKNNTELKLDISAFDWYHLHAYRLDNFNINATIATKEEISIMSKYGRYEHLFRHALDLITPYYERTYIRQREQSFDPNILKVGGNAYLAGYWASEKYFIDIADEIRKDFTLKKEPDWITAKISGEIVNTNSVSLHIRRTDYVDMGVTLPLDYYDRAIDDVCKHIDNPHFFVFSDDHKWAEENLSLPYPATFVMENGAEKDYNDIYLMSLCRCHIVANSTFSWWGAWLDPNKKKRVYVPKNWFQNSPTSNMTVNIIMKDINPESWHGL